MVLRQFLHADPVAISYLFGCGGRATCAVVDPVGDIRPYLETADESGMRIDFAVDTHIHADHRSAGRTLASEIGARYVLFAGADAEDAAAGARTLFASLQRLKLFPHHMEVLPGAYAGSVCGRRLSGQPFSTIGFERRHNSAFRIDAAEEFVEFMLHDMPPPPVDAAEIRAWNSGHRAAAAE